MSALWPGRSREIPGYVGQPYDLVADMDSRNGFNTASFTINAAGRMNPDILGDLLGRHVRVFDQSGTVVWEGYVDKASANYTGAGFSAGPVTDIVNSLRVSFRGIDWGVAPVQSSGSQVTEFLQDKESIARWGVLEGDTSLRRECEPEEAERSGLYIVSKMSAPRFSRTLTGAITTQENITPVHVECVGYYTLFDKVHYEVFDEHGAEWDITSAIEDLITNVRLVSFQNEGEIGVAIGVYTGEWDAPSRIASDILEEYITAAGRGGGYGYLFGVYENRTAVFREITKPLVAQYTLRMNPRQATLIGEGPLRIPRPGEWIHVPGGVPFIGRDMANTAMFPISTVEFRDTGELTINELPVSLLQSDKDFVWDWGNQEEDKGGGKEGPGIDLPPG